MAEFPKIQFKISGSWAPLIAIGFALFTDGFLYQMLVPLTPLSKVDVLDVGHEEFLYGGYALSVMVLTPFFSWIANHVGYKKALIGGSIAQIIATLLFALAPSFAILLTARFFQGASSAIAWTVGLALIAENYPDQRVRSMGLMMSATTLGLIAGPMIGGLMFHTWGYHAPFIVAVLFTLLDLTLRSALLVHLPRMQVVRDQLPRPEFLPARFIAADPLGIHAPLRGDRPFGLIPLFKSPR